MQAQKAARILTATANSEMSTTNHCIQTSAPRFPKNSKSILGLPAGIYRVLLILVEPNQKHFLKPRKSKCMSRDPNMHFPGCHPSRRPQPRVDNIAAHQRSCASHVTSVFWLLDVAQQLYSMQHNWLRSPRKVSRSDLASCGNPACSTIKVKLPGIPFVFEKHPPCLDRNMH